MKTWSILLAMLFLVVTGPAPAVAKILPKMRISVENTDTHVQTMAVKRFADDLKIKLSGQIDVQLYTNAQLFRDRDIIQALGHDRVEMAVPGTWHVTRFEPNVGLFLLPVFYGRSVEDNHAVLDSEIGIDINRRIERNLRQKVVGRWLDLGHAHLFGVNHAIADHKDIAGLRVRVAGGIANKLRIEAFGGKPTIIPWPDLPEYMRRNRIDALLTSYETIRSARLWEAGVDHVFEDCEYFPQYVPMVRLSFWDKLPPAIQETIMTTWEAYVDESRRAAAEAQVRAKEKLLRHGVKVVVPDPRQIERWRNQLLGQQQRFIQALDIDPELVRQVDARFGVRD